MKQVQHPSFYIPSSSADIIRLVAGDAEKLGSLHPAQLEQIYQHKWFNLWVPVVYGGLELSLTEALMIEEGLAWADGSTGWTVTLCSGANWFVGFLDPALAGDLFRDKKVCLAGSGKATGIASVRTNGYEITGNWNYATGALHATAFTSNCVVEKDGITMRNIDGSPVVRSFLFLKEEVVIHESRKMMGMVATGSYSFEVSKLQVGKERCFEINNQSAFLQLPVYQYPFLQFAEATLAVNSSGMAIGFLDLCEQVITAGAGYTYPSVTDARERLQQARQLFYEAVQSSWKELELRNSVAVEILHQVSRTSRALAAIARQVVDELYPFCGMIAADPASEINRVWRNLHTASQHNLLNFPR
ncbi:MAG: acyl-CoA dehydrogenase [Chitinophagaceae bacterium]